MFILRMGLDKLEIWINEYQVEALWHHSDSDHAD